MFELSKFIYALLNVSSITTIATGKVWPLLSEQGKRNFVTYAFSVDNSESKDNRNRNTLVIHCVADNYDTALQMHDAVEEVLRAESIYLNNMDSLYVDDTFESAVRSTYILRK